MCGSGSIAPRNRTNPSSTRARERDSLLPSWWLHHLWKSLGTNPSFAAMEREIHLEPPSPVRCQGRISFHRASSAHSEQQPGWGQDSSWSFTPSRRPSQCCIWLVASFLLALTLGTTPWSPTCPPLPCRGSLPGFASPLPGTTRGHGPRRTRSSLPVSGVSSRSPTSTRPTVCPAPGDHTRKPETFPV